LGRLPDAVDHGIDDSAAALTDPDQAADFVQQTACDCLAVSIGNVHLLTSGYAPVDLDRLGKIHQRVSVPLVIHGGTSFPPDAVTRAVASGAAKFNVGTILKIAFLEGVCAVLSADSMHVHDILGSHKNVDVLNAGKARMRAKVQEFMRIYGSSGRAE
jgi:fructose/tagatose bisphosphate aldolase